MSWSERLQQAWYRADGKDWLSWALLDASWIYGGLTRLRRAMYAGGLLHSEAQSVPVIVVGNVIAGGAGKTPVVIALSQLLERAGYAVGIISRGYGRSSRRLLQVLPDTPILESGDEPALIRSAQNAPVFVSSDRAQAAQALLSAYPATQVILSDDGLQHLALQRDIEICLFDERGIGNARLLPAGPLREAWPRPVDFVLHRGNMPEGFKLERKLAPYALEADGSHIDLALLKEQNIIALAAIAQPQSFFDMLCQQGLKLADTLAFPDHYDFNSILRIFDEGQWLICTEKDAVKLWRTPLAQRCRIVAVPLQVNLPAEFCAAVLEKLSSLLAKN